MTASPLAKSMGEYAGGSARFYVPFVLLLLVIAELGIFDFVFQASLYPLKSRNDILFIVGYLNIFPLYIIKGLFGFAIILLAKFSNYYSLIFCKHCHRRRYFATHVAAITILYLTLSVISYAGTGMSGTKLAWLSCVLFVAFFFSTLSSMFMIAPSQFWGRFVREQKWLILLVLICLVLYKFITLWFYSYDYVLADYMFLPTVQVAAFLDNLFGYSTFIDATTYTFGIGGFSVSVGAPCLGYQGIGLILLFLSSYIFFCQKQLRFPNVLLVIPLAVVSMWLLNAARIALLMAIGASWSPDIAVQGFHSAAGWLSLTFAALLSVISINRIQWFTNQPITKIFNLTDENILLIPQLALIAVSFGTLLFTASFDWLYPVRVLVVGALLLYFRQSISCHLNVVRLNPVAVGIGIVIFLIWIVFVPDSAEKSQEFASTLFSVSWIGISGWMIFRIIGAVIIVPFTEELAFRGFLLPYLENVLSTFTAPVRLVGATLISSAIFGSLHGSWLAGTLAGIGFAAAKYHRGQLFDAIFAHMIANLLLVAYVIIGTHWSYW